MLTHVDPVTLIFDLHNERRCRSHQVVWSNILSRFVCKMRTLVRTESADMYIIHNMLIRSHYGDRFIVLLASHFSNLRYRSVADLGTHSDSRIARSALTRNVKMLGYKHGVELI